MAPWQVLRGRKVSQATQGYRVHHGPGGSVQYSTAPAAAAASDSSSRSFYLSREKFTLQQLNRRLASYMQQVQSLEAANQRLEQQIQQELDKKCPKELRQLDGHLKTVSELQEQISERICAQAHLKLQLLTLELHGVDLKNRSEKEKERRIHLEAALEDLRLLEEELHVRKVPELRSLADAHKQQLAILQIQHQQDVQGLLSQVSWGVAMEMQPAQSSDLRQQLDNLRQTSVTALDKNQNDSWLNTQVSVLTSDDAAVSEVISAELEGLRGTAVSLEEELAQLRALNELLEASGMEKNDSIMETLEQLQHRADGLNRDLDSVLQATARQDANHQALLGIKSRLEAEIHDYKRLLDGLSYQGVSKSAVTSFLPPSGVKRDNIVSYGKANHHLGAVQTVFTGTGKLPPLISEKVTAVQSITNLSNMKNSPKTEWFHLPENDRMGASADWIERESMATSTTVNVRSESIEDVVQVKGQDLQNSLISDAQITHDRQHVYQEKVIVMSSETEMKSTAMPDTHSLRSANILPTPENITSETDKDAMTNMKSEIIKSVSGTEVMQEQGFGTEIATNDPTAQDTVVEDTPLDANDDSIRVEKQHSADACDALITSFGVTESRIVTSEEDQREVLEEFNMQHNKDKDPQLERGEEGGDDFHMNKSEEDQELAELNTLEEKDKDQQLEREIVEVGSHICKSEVAQDELLDKLNILEEREKDQQLVKGEEIEIESNMCRSERDHDEVYEELKIQNENDKDQYLERGKEGEIETEMCGSERDHDEVYEELKIQNENDKDQYLERGKEGEVETEICGSERDHDEVYEELKIQDGNDKVEYLEKGEEREVETDTCVSERDTDEVSDELNILGGNDKDEQFEKGEVVDECDVCGIESKPDEVYEELSVLDVDKGQQLEKDEDLGIESDICGSERDEDDVYVELCKEEREVGVEVEDHLHVFTIGQSSSLGEVKENADTGSSLPAPLFLGPKVSDDNHAPDDLTAETLKIVEIEMNDREEVNGFNDVDDLKNKIDNNAEIKLTEGPEKSRTKTQMSTDSGVLLSSSDNEELLSPREADVFLSPTAPLTEVLMSITDHQFCPVSLEDNVGSPDSPMSPDDPERYLTQNDLEKCASPNCEDEDEEACLNLTEASPASVKPVEKYTLSTKEESQSLTFGGVGALPEENRNRIVTISANKGDSLCFGSFGSTENSGGTVSGTSTDNRPVNQVISSQSGFSSGESDNKNIIADKEKQLGSGGLDSKSERHSENTGSDRSPGVVSGYKTAPTPPWSLGRTRHGSGENIVYGSNSGHTSANSETSLSGTCQPKRGRFGSGGSGEWVFYGSNVRLNSGSVSIPATGSEDGPLVSPHMATSPLQTGRFNSGRNMEWMVQGGGLGHTSASLPNAGAKERTSVARPLATSPPGQRLGRVGSMEWMVSGSKHSKNMVRSNSLHNADGDKHAEVAFHLATSPPDTGRFGRGEWRVYGRSCRRGNSLDGSLSRLESKESPPVASQLPTSPPVTPRTGRFSSTSSGEWRVYGGSTERLSRSSSSDRVGVAAMAGQIISPPGSHSGPRLSSSGGSGRYSTKPGAVVRRSSSVGSGGRLSSTGSGGRLSCSTGTSGNPGRFTSSSSEWKPVYSSASGRRSSVGSGVRAGGGSTHRAPSPGGAFSGGSGGWLSTSTAGGNRISGAGLGSKPSTEGRVITSSNRPMRSTGSGSGANRERISVCKMAALSISKAGRERSQDRQSQAQRSQQKNASAVSPLIQRWLTTDVGVLSGDGNNDMTRP